MRRNAVWIEAALNGSWTRARQPGIPVTVDETVEAGISAAQEGAAIIHVHAYDGETGIQNDDPDTYAEIVRGIQDEIDVIVYPTISNAAQPGSEVGVVGAHRFLPARHLGELGCLEWTIVDPGSANLSRFADVRADEVGTVYMNVESDIRAGFATAAEYGANPTMAIYEPGFVRLGAALMERNTDLAPAIYRFMFSDEFTFGFPVRRYGLDAYLAQLDEVAPGAHWMIATLGGDITPLIADAVALGGHIRVGLEDAPFGCRSSNADLVSAAVEEVLRAGCTVASAADVRRDLRRA